MTDQFDGKVVLVTGAGRGYGREIALAFAALGARVAVDDLTPVNLDETVAQIEAAGGTVRAHLFDIAKKMPAQALVETVLEEWGRIDILVNNAGVHPRAALLGMDEWDWQRTLEVNLFGPFYLIQAAGRLMREQGGGVIINIGSAEAMNLALDPTGREQNRAGAVLPAESGAYLASKSGLLGLTRAAALELAPHHIRVNTICPGSAAPDSDERVPPEQVAELAVFLSSQEALEITGQAILAGAIRLKEEQAP